ncbi:hypothetical protein [Halopseudomonas bauzanensis]|uniref:Uncharacterized protein n=1 Tax=Halopseudomonas bauzanensis TaxID=653930 RepID=A0A4V5NK66_9GAMM|nr:hypothetical protein [Halopseudomonas bauzanensis]TKA90367.1 hypothetical protein FA869_14715 [Halopseudomonas bauzanensis]
MRPTPDPIKVGEQAGIEAAVADFMRSGGSIQEFDSGCRPIKNYSWRDQGDASWNAKLAGDLPPKPAPAPKPKAKPRSLQRDTKAATAARSTALKQARDKMAGAVRELAALNVSRNKIAEALEVSAKTVGRIADEHGIQLPLHARSGTRQAKANAELRGRADQG